MEWAGKGLTPRFPNHVLVYQPAGKEYAKTNQVLLPLSSGENQGNRFRNSFAFLHLRLVCPCCRDHFHRLTECATAKTCREVAYFFIRALRTEQRLALNWEQKNSSFLHLSHKIDGKCLMRESLDLNKLQIWSYFLPIFMFSFLALLTNTMKSSIVYLHIEHP